MIGVTVLACGVQDFSINRRQFFYEVLHHITVARAFFTFLRLCVLKGYVILDRVRRPFICDD